MIATIDLAEFDGFWLMSAASTAGGALLLLVGLAGLILSVRYWRAAGTSARLAAAGFACLALTEAEPLVGRLYEEFTGRHLLSFVDTSSGMTSLWPLVVVHAASAVGSFASAVLLAAGLWTAWRRIARAASR